MPRTSRALIVSRLSLLAALLLLSRSVVAQTVWSGLTKSFSKADFTDGTLPQYQDSLTANVVFTRVSSGGLINIAAESSYTLAVSPMDTEWATNINNASQTIAATNWQNLAFTDWIDAFGGPQSGGASIAGRDAAVHLVTDNIYLDLRFSSWTTGAGGGFAYMRAEPPAALPPTGDYNGNHIVDAADYVVWRKTQGQTGVPLGSGADGNANGTIEIGDFNYWRARFGNVIESGLGAGAAVPEPSTFTLALLGLISFQRLRSRNG